MRGIIGMSEKKKYSAEELLQYAYKYDKIPVILFAKDTDCRYVYTSEVENLIDSGEEHSILGKTDKEIQYDEKLGQEYYEQDKEIIRTGKPCHCYSEFMEDGRPIVREIAKNPVYSNGEIIGVCGIVSDVTELMNLKKKFELLSFRDNLTGLYNRNYFLKFDFERKMDQPCAYIMCDCNDLKKVNDRQGHEAGDAYILTTAKLLKSVLPEEGICVRWGGDEFLLIIPRCNEDVCRELVKKIEEGQLKARKEKPYINIAVGYAIREDLGQKEEDIIRQADQNMYQDKLRRKGH